MLDCVTTRVALKWTTSLGVLSMGADTYTSRGRPVPTRSACLSYIQGCCIEAAPAPPPLSLRPNAPHVKWRRRRLDGCAPKQQRDARPAD